MTTMATLRRNVAVSVRSNRVDVTPPESVRSTLDG
jgi:hypothetical protein